MLIVNADDWGRTVTETDAAAVCLDSGRVTSATAMVFMEDSIRAATIALERGYDIGLHLNLIEPFSGRGVAPAAQGSLRRVGHFLGTHKLAQLVYNPLLKADFRTLYRAQVEEFQRLYGRPPSHVDGHHHLHLCTNMLVDEVIERGMKVRRSFHFWPDEKGWLNRTYRRVVDRSLARRHPLADYFFALPHCMDPRRMGRVLEVARSATVEIMTHPVNPKEQEFLLGEVFERGLGTLPRATFAAVPSWT